MPNTELLLILAAPDSALRLLSIYHQRKQVQGGLDFHHSQIRQLPMGRGGRRGSDCLGLDSRKR